jgi:hypothetical protein
MLKSLALSTFTSSCNTSARVTVLHFWERYYKTAFASDLHPLLVPLTLLMPGRKESRSKQGLDFKSVTETISVHTRPRHNSTHATSQEHESRQPASYSDLLQTRLHDDLQTNPRPRQIRAVPSVRPLSGLTQNMAFQIAGLQQLYLATLMCNRTSRARDPMRRIFQFT